jgi:hypothetical protein
MAGTPATAPPRAAPVELAAAGAELAEAGALDRAVEAELRAESVTEACFRGE